MTRLAKDLLSNVIGEVIDMDRVRDELNQMEGDFGESGEEAYQQVEKYLNSIMETL